MAILSMTYPDIVSNFAGFGGGIEWLVPLDNSHDIRIGSVKEIDISSVDPTVNNAENTAKTFEAFDLSDKASIEIDFWYRNNDPDHPDILEGRFYLRKKGTNQRRNTNESYPSGSAYAKKGITNLDFNAYAGAGKFCYARKNIIDTYKIRLLLVTEYYDNLVNPNGFGIVALFPSYNTQYPASLQSWAHVNTGFMGGSNGLMFDYSNPDASDIYYPFRGCGYSVLWISDLDHFNNFVKGYDQDYDITKSITIGNYEEDPIQEIDPSTPGGGGGSYDPGSDPIDFPDLPTGGALASGACKAYEITSTNLKQIFSKLWSSSVFDLNDFQKLVDNPMDCIISLHAIPVSPLTSANNDVWIGNFNTEVTGASIGSQYVAVDCGAINVKEFWGSALDYNPYTECDIYLPFIGIRKLNVDDVMNNIIHVKYNIDVLNGDCVANIKCGNSVLYKFAGNLKQDIPVTGRASNMSMNAIQGGISALAQGIIGGAIGGPVGAATAIAGGLSAASSVVGSKVSTQRSSGLTGNSGVLDEYTPYLILHRPIQSLANKFKTFKGYPSNITDVLGNLTGYTEVEFINLQNIPNATSAEMDEIKNLLSKGVLI